MMNMETGTPKIVTAGKLSRLETHTTVGNTHSAAPQYEFLCARCNVNCPTKSALITHINGTHMHLSVHQKLTFNCSKCPKVYSSTSCLIRHSLKKHGIVEYKCEQCGKIFAKSRGLALHSVIHKPPQFSCSECGGKFFRPTGLLFHTKSVHLRATPTALVSTKTQFPCQLCQKEFTTSKALKGHLANIHQPREHKCPHCYMEFSVVVELNRHLLKAHSVYVKPDLQCQICQKVFKDRLRLVQHSQFHGKPTLSCRQCPHKFYATSHLSQHIKRTHTVRFTMPAKRTLQEISYTCAVCCRPFGLKKKNLRTHLRTHYFKPQVCQVCHQMFNSETALERHRRVKHCDNGLTIHCDICNKLFRSHENYDAHRKYHEKPTLACPDCPLLFYTIGVLLCHSNFHNNIKRDRSSKRVMSVGRPSRIFGCAICSREFPIPFQLRKHLIHHNNPPTFSCAQCYFQCLTKRFLSRHLENFHKIK